MIRRIQELIFAVIREWRYAGFFALVQRIRLFLQNERRYRFKQELTDEIYHQWIQRHEMNKSELSYEAFSYRPLISLLCPVYKPDLRAFKEMIESVQTQGYSDWQLILVNGDSSPELLRLIETYRVLDSRIELVQLKQNLGIAGNLNQGFAYCCGDFIGFLDHDDRLADSALAYVVQSLNENPKIDIIYTDEDKLDEAGKRTEAFFKPNWSPELLISCNYLAHFFLFRRELLEKFASNPLDSALDGAQDWDFYLRLSLLTESIHHIGKILYHWRKSPQSTAQKLSNKKDIQIVQAKTIRKHLQSFGAEAIEINFSQNHAILEAYPRIRWKPQASSKVSIIIPSRDKAEILQACLESIYQAKTDINWEIILVDTGSSKAETFQLYEEYQAYPNFHLLHFSEAFNFSAACNLGAKAATGDFYLFLNNDVKVLNHDWLERMLQWFIFPKVGIVGAKLVYPNRKIQHAGVIVGMRGLAGHLFAEQQEYCNSSFGNDFLYRNYMAVTGACLMIRRRLFEEIGGFDEGFKLNYSDIDLCLQAHKKSYRIVYTSDTKLIHYEGSSHNGLIPQQDFIRASELWQHYFQTGDPYFNPNLSYAHQYPSLMFSSMQSSLALNQQLIANLPDKASIQVKTDLAGL